MTMIDKVNLINEVSQVNIQYSKFSGMWYVKTTLRLLFMRGKYRTYISINEHRLTIEEAIDACWNKITNIEDGKVLTNEPMKHSYKWNGNSWDIEEISLKLL